MKIIQSPFFSKIVKKLHKQEKLILDEAIKELIENPQIGEEKKGDLENIFIYKFKINNLRYLLAYRYSETLIELIMLGPHENYYRNLKNYLN